MKKEIFYIFFYSFIFQDTSASSVPGEESSSSLLDSSANSATTPGSVVAQPKGIKKLTTSLRHRSPSGHSPVSKSRKPSQASVTGGGFVPASSADAAASAPSSSSANDVAMTVVDPFLPSPKTRTWRGRVAKQFRKIQHHNSHHSSQQRNSASSLAEVNTTLTTE